jgi:hypothetical protein
MANERILGVVRNGYLRRLTPIRDLGIGCRLTREAPGAAAPESGEIDLRSYEGCAVLVEGEPLELWVYSAVVVEQAGPIVTELVQYVLGQPEAAIDPSPRMGT